MLKWLLILIGIVAALVVFRVLGTRPTSSSATPPSLGPSGAPTFVAGSRVVISPEYHWAQGVTGAIADPPDRVRTLAGNWQGVSRIVKGVRGPLVFYWVNFDQPQLDTENDGPYFGAEIDSAYLRPSDSAIGVTPAPPDGIVDAVWYENKRLGIRVEFKAFVKE